MSVHRPELRRRLVEADQVQREVLPRWRAQLTHLFGPGDRGRGHRMPAAVRAELLGVPGRRQFLRIGGTTIAGAAVLAACAPDHTDVAETGTTQPPDTASSTTVGTTTTTEPTEETETANRETNLSLLRTATSLELLAVDVYETVIEQVEAGDLRLDAGVVDAARLFRDHHDEHAGELQGATRSLDGEAFEEPNAYVLETVVTPALPTLTDEARVVAFARDLELTAAATYTESMGSLTTAELRQTFIGIGSVEARHAAALNLVIAEAVSERPLLDTRNRAPDAAAVPAEGEQPTAEEAAGG